MELKMIICVRFSFCSTFIRALRKPALNFILLTLSMIKYTSKLITLIECLCDETIERKTHRPVIAIF